MEGPEKAFEKGKEGHKRPRFRGKNEGNNDWETFTTMTWLAALGSCAHSGADQLCGKGQVVWPETWRGDCAREAAPSTKRNPWSVRDGTVVFTPCGMFQKAPEIPPCWKQVLFQRECKLIHPSEAQDYLVDKWWHLNLLLGEQPLLQGCKTAILFDWQIHWNGLANLELPMLLTSNLEKSDLVVSNCLGVKASETKSQQWGNWKETHVKYLEDRKKYVHFDSMGNWY